MREPRIPQAIVDRIMRRRGRMHVFDALEPEKTCLLVVDMQNAYLMPDEPGYVPAGPGIVPNVNRLAGVVRDRGGHVVWLRNTFDREGAKTWHVWHDYLRAGQSRERMVEALREGSAGHRLWQGMDVRPADTTLDKYRYSAFIEGSCDVEARLRARGADTLLIAGVLTNVCCESTARDAAMLDFKTIVIADATAAHTEAEHSGALANVLLLFGDVMTTDEAVERLEGRTARTARPIWG